MHLVIVKTFLTAVADADDADEDDGASCLLRRHSAPPAFQYTDRASPLAEPKTARHRQKKIAAKAQNATLATAADAADEAVFLEFAAKVEEERRQQGGEPEPFSPALTRRKERRHLAKATGCAADNHPRIRLCIRFHGPDEERPSNAIFLLREDANAEIGVVYDPDWSTTELRDRLLRINGFEEDDDAVVTTVEGQLVRAGSTLGEQNVMPGARLKLVRVGSSENDCAQS